MAFKRGYPSMGKTMVKAITLRLVPWKETFSLQADLKV
jgi:hypothetical protein